MAGFVNTFYILKNMISEKRRIHILRLALLPRTNKQKEWTKCLCKLPKTLKQRETSRILMQKIGKQKRTKLWNLRVSQSLKRKPKKAIFQKICLKCRNIFFAKSKNRRFCEICCPDNRYANIITKYGLSKSEYDNLLLTNNGLCWICLKRKAQVVDHNHKTNQVRGLLCKYCNASLNIVEDEFLLKRALIYLKSDFYAIRI